MINFNVPPCTGNEMKYIEQAIASHKICGDGSFTKKCSAWLEQRFDAKKVLLTTSGSSALDFLSSIIPRSSGRKVKSFSFPKFGKMANRNEITASSIIVIMYGSTPIFSKSHVPLRPPDGSVLH